MKIYSTPNEIKVGVVGYGGAFNMGKKHLEEMQRAGMKPVAVTEIDPERLTVATTDFPGIGTFPSLDAMLDGSDVDLIVLITPHDTHFPLAKQCVDAGRSVVTEKPFVLTTDECDRLIAAAKERDVLVSTYHNRHWDGWILRALERIHEDKALGEVYKVEAHMGGYDLPKNWWRSNKTTSGGILYDWGVHLLEYSLQVVKSDVVEVSGFAKTGYWASLADDTHRWKQDPNEDEATAVVRFASGAFVNLSISQLRSDPRPWFIAFYGTKGSYEIAWQGWTERLAGEDGKLAETKGEHPEGEGWRFYQNIADALTGKADLVITPQWARRPIHILDLADQSARQNKTLVAKYG